jgi:hypothetical protein
MPWLSSRDRKDYVPFVSAVLEIQHRRHRMPHNLSYIYTACAVSHLTLDMNSCNDRWILHILFDMSVPLLEPAEVCLKIPERIIYDISCI